MRLTRRRDGGQGRLQEGDLARNGSGKGLSRDGVGRSAASARAAFERLQAGPAVGLDGHHRDAQVPPRAAPTSTSMPRLRATSVIVSATTVGRPSSRTWLNR